MPNELQPINFNQDQVNLITRTIAKGASKDELMLFIGVCKRTGLDPFARQIFMLPRREYDRASNMTITKMSIMASIDGLRLVAQRSQEYEGQTPAQWCGDDGVWTDVWLKAEPPAAAKVSVHRSGFKEPLTAIALYTAYVQTGKEGKAVARWASDPAGMLAKCAEALALRKAFPQELSGLYTNDEMPGAGDIPAARATVVEREHSAALPSGDDDIGAGGSNVAADDAPAPAVTTTVPAEPAAPSSGEPSPAEKAAVVGSQPAGADEPPFTTASEYMNRLMACQTDEEVTAVERDIVLERNGLNEHQTNMLMAQVTARREMIRGKS